VSLTGISGAPSNLVVSPLNVDFGPVAQGTSETLSFTLENTGGSDLTISTSNPPALGAFVAQTSLPVGTTIAAGQTVTETVQFAANASGTITDVWQIAANDSTGLHNVTFTATSSTVLPRTGWVATASSTGGTDVPANAIDSSLATRWTTGVAQSNAGTQWFTVDLQTAHTFNQIRMDSGGDYVRNYQVFVSADGVNWGSAVATGSAAATPVIVTFANQTARFIQVQQLTSAGTGSWWSIDDFNVIAGGTPLETPLARTGWTAIASATGGTDVPTNAIDVSTATRWSTGQPQWQAATQWFTLDMQAPQTFSQITMTSGSDYARSWEVYVSSDGTSWGMVAAMGVATSSPITVYIPSTSARYLQIRQTSSPGTGSWWSIYDLNVYP
jgi:beta-glucosidase